MQWNNEGGEVLELGGAHLYERNLEALHGRGMYGR